ncbi:MAG: hypothetical protein ACI8S6_003123 [Myxococcota bacterium]
MSPKTICAAPAKNEKQGIHNGAMSDHAVDHRCLGLSDGEGIVAVEALSGLLLSKILSRRLPLVGELRGVVEDQNAVIVRSGATPGLFSMRSCQRVWLHGNVVDQPVEPLQSRTVAKDPREAMRWMSIDGGQDAHCASVQPLVAKVNTSKLTHDRVHDHSTVGQPEHPMAGRRQSQNSGASVPDQSDTYEMCGIISLAMRVIEKGHGSHRGSPIGVCKDANALLRAGHSDPSPPHWRAHALPTRACRELSGRLWSALPPEMLDG